MFIGYGCMHRLAARLAKLSNEANTQLAQFREPQTAPLGLDTGAGDPGMKRGTKGGITMFAHGTQRGARL